MEGRGAGLLAAKSSRDLQRSGRRPASSQSQLRSCQAGPKGAWWPSFTKLNAFKSPSSRLPISLSTVPQQPLLG